MVYNADIMKHPITLSLSTQAMADLKWLVQDTGLTKTAIVELSIQALRRLWETPIVSFVQVQDLPKQATE